MNNREKMVSTFDLISSSSSDDDLEHQEFREMFLDLSKSKTT